MRFLVDAQLPPALARWLVSQGHEAEHVADVEMTAATDAEIWDHAKRTNAVIITKDEDFSILHNLGNLPIPRVVWLRVGNTRRSELLELFHSLIPRIISALDQGETLIEID